MDTVRIFLHVLGATVWVGGQLTVLGLLPVLRRLGGEAPTLVARQFNRIAWPAFGLLLLTGVWNLLAEGDEVDQAVMGVKYLAVLASGVGAFLHARAATPRGKGIWGAVGFLGALAALLLGVILAGD